MWCKNQPHWIPEPRGDARKPGYMVKNMEPDEVTKFQESCLQAPRAVCSLRLCAQREDQDGGENQELHTGSEEGNDRRAGGDRRVPRLPGVEEPEEGSIERQLGGSGGLEEPIAGSGQEWTEQSLQRDGRLLRQATVALRESEQMWAEIMNLLRSPGTDADGRIQALRQKFNASGTDLTRSRKFLKFAGRLLGGQVKPKQVSELFNPNRFQPSVSAHSLRPGVAFDLELGDDVLRVSDRKYIREYFEAQKPGLVVISPPCVMFSALQALNVRHLATPERLRIHLRRMAEAKVLLNFAVEICEVVHGYGGTFVLEHPWTSRAWRSTKILHLFNQKGVRLAYNDQCVFGLKSYDGQLHKKPTGWLTNSRTIFEELNRSCSGAHSHELIMGGNAGGSRSRQAQHYPPKLVDAILRAYAESLHNLKRKVEVYSVMRSIKNALAFETAYVEHQSLAELPVRDVLKVRDIHAVEDVIVDEDVPMSEEGERPVESGRSATEGGEHSATEEGETRYRLLPREKPFSVAQLVRRAHTGLGHPTTETLVRILTTAKASPEAIAAARDLKCSVCHQHQKIRPSRAAAPPRNLHVNSIVGVDTMWVQGLTPNGPRRMALNIVDWASRFQMVIPLERHTPEAARQAFSQWLQ